VLAGPVRWRRGRENRSATAPRRKKKWGAFGKKLTIAAKWCPAAGGGCWVGGGWSKKKRPVVGGEQVRHHGIRK